MPVKLFTCGQAAALVSVPRHRLAYLIEASHVPGPSIVVPGRRLFTAGDIERIRTALDESPRLREGRPRSSDADSSRAE